MNAIPVVRGCGSRVKGGIYLECGLGPGGSPLEDFLICPPLLLDVKALGITPVGTKLIKRGSAWHVVDWVGEEYYPNVCDFTEEIRKFGLSRRLAKNTDFSKLTPESRILLLHSRAYVANFDDFDAVWAYSEDSRPGHPFPRCPKGIVGHDQENAPGCCTGVYWQDIVGGTEVAGSKVPRRCERMMPSFRYHGSARPADVAPEYLPAVFASFPISRIVAVQSTAREDARNRKLLDGAGLPTAFEAE